MVWFDTYSAGISLIASAMFETLAVMYIYGMCCSNDGNFCHHNRLF